MINVNYCAMVVLSSEVIHTALFQRIFNSLLCLDLVYRLDRVVYVGCQSVEEMGC